jgi:hypothetical protein
MHAPDLRYVGYRFSPDVIGHAVWLYHRAKYDDGRETNLSGREADGLYDPLSEIRKLGGGPQGECRAEPKIEQAKEKISSAPVDGS